MRSTLHRALLLACALLVLPAPLRAQAVKLLVQKSPLAGFQFYAGREIWEQMKEGDALDLVREPENRHDANAVRVEWRGMKLGYLPRAENRAVAAEMDRGARVEARIARLQRHRDPWQRIRLEVFVLL